MYKPLILIMLLTTSAIAGNEITGSVAIQTQPSNAYNYTTGRHDITYDQRVITKLGVNLGSYKTKIQSSASLNINDVRDLAAEITFNIMLP